VLLHVSLRDLTVQAILASHNVVDDTDHVCREQTSLHLAEQHTGNRDFIHATLGALLRGRVELPRDPARTLVFSPFGLGILDLALAGFVRARVAADGGGVPVADFLPPAQPWPARTAANTRGGQ
jgi:ornithine cyclodeaminase